jgi:hypothetical protein
MEFERIPIHVAVDEQGNRAVSLESVEEAREALEEYEPVVVRVTTVDVAVPLPKVEDFYVEDEPVEAEELPAVKAEPVAA